LLIADAVTLREANRDLGGDDKYKQHKIWPIRVT